MEWEEEINLFCCKKLDIYAGFLHSMCLPWIQIVWLVTTHIYRVYDASTHVHIDQGSHQRTHHLKHRPFPVGSSDGCDPPLLRVGTLLCSGTDLLLPAGCPRPPIPHAAPTFLCPASGHHRDTLSLGGSGVFRAHGYVRSRGIRAWRLSPNSASSRPARVEKDRASASLGAE